MVDIAVRPNPKEILARMSPRIYETARTKGISLTQLLEVDDPSSRYTSGEVGHGLDAFERLLQAAGIITRSDPARGIYAQTMDRLLADQNTRALVPEFVARIQRRTAYATARSTVTSDTQPRGDTLNQWVYRGGVVMEQIAPQIPLAEILATTTPIQGNAYKSLRLEDTPAQRRLVRVGQIADIPKVKVTYNDNEVVFYKFGRGLQISYEALRRLPIDVFALHVQRIAVQNEVDKVAVALDTIINGDGNANTAATETDITTLDAAATGNVPTLRGWQAFKLLFAQPYMMTHAFAESDMALELLLMNSGSANIPLGFLPATQFGTFTPINPQLADGVRLGVTADAPTGKIVAIDRRFALEQLVEIGSDITETMRWANNQTEDLYISEVSGFSVLDARAARVLDAAN